MWPADFGWRDLVAVMTAATIIGGMVIAWVKWQLAGEFVLRADITGIASRIERVEQQLKAAPTHDDVRQLTDRVGRVERGVEVANAHMEGVKDGMRRVENDLRLLVEHHIRTGS